MNQRSGAVIRLRRILRTGVLAITTSGFLWLSGCGRQPEPHPVDRSAAQESTPAEWLEWAEWVEGLHPVGDGQGHGPDVGSTEWSQALSRQLGMTDASEGRFAMGSMEWRRAVEAALDSSAPKP